MDGGVNSILIKGRAYAKAKTVKKKKFVDCQKSSRANFK